MQRVLMEQRSILALYKKDIGRYDPEDKLYINDIFDLIPPELNAKNKRFILKNLNVHFKFSRHENSFTWLRDADTEIIPLEVKSGKDYDRHVALNNVMKNVEYGIREAIVLCNDNLSTRGNVTYAPIYMLMFIKKMKDEGAKIYKLDLGGLV